MHMMQSLRTRRACVATLALLGSATLPACHRNPNADVEVEVRSVGFDMTSHAPIVVLQDRNHKVALPIWIGPTEAQAIAMQLQGVTAPRPMTYDLIKTVLDSTGITFQKAVIQNLKNNVYYARIFLHQGQHDLQIDSRPSDAIALALRFHRPIFVAAALMKGAAAIDLERVAPATSTVQFSGLTVQNLTDALAEYFGLPAGRGVIVAAVAADAPRGLQRGDVILEVNGVPVTGVGDFTSKLRAIAKGKAATLSVQRAAQRLRVAFAVRSG